MVNTLETLIRKIQYGGPSNTHFIQSSTKTYIQVKNMRPHIKMLLGDFLTYQTKSEQSGGSPHCRFGCVRHPLRQDAAF